MKLTYHNKNMKKRLKRLAIVLLTLFLGLPGAWAVADIHSARQAVQNLLDAIRHIQMGDQLSAKQLKSNRDYSQAALQLLDLREVSQRALGKYWTQRTPEERKLFSELLKELFVKVAFPNSGKFFAELKVVYGDTQVRKKLSIVPVRVIHKEEGEIGIDFHLRQSGGKWRVVDVLLDEISMRNNLRSQFYRIIAKNNYQELIRRMEKRLKKSERKS